MIHIIGYGGQGKAWVPSLREAEFDVQLYLPEGSQTFELTKSQGINALRLNQLLLSLKENDTVVFACPDRVIGEVYTKNISTYSKPLHLILIHGFAMWSGDLKLNPLHTVGLLAPKAIGPELREAIVQCKSTDNKDQCHPLKAAICVSADSSLGEQVKNNALKNLRSLAKQGLQFSEENLIEATFDQETVGDLISEQLLLCGGVFSLLEWTQKEMKAAGIPDALIHEECITELELIARVIRKKGLPETIAAISDSAKAGAVMMRNRFVEHKLPELLHQQAREVVDKTFLNKLIDEKKWRAELKNAFGAKS